MAKTLQELCLARDVELVEKPNGHCQLKGDLLVNYYPYSKKRSAYVAGTTRGAHNVSAGEAVQMCFSAPSMVKKEDRAKRKKNSSRKIRERMLRKIPNCYWCGVKLTINTSTLEHKVPLARGGLDQPNNRTLACYECNQARGCDMTELNKVRVLK